MAAEGVVAPKDAAGVAALMDVAGVAASWDAAAAEGLVYSIER